MKTIVFLSNHENQAVSFYRTVETNFYVGYRFIEGTPEITDDVILDYSLQPVSSIHDDIPLNIENIKINPIEPPRKGWLVKYDDIEEISHAHLKFATSTDGSAHAEISQAHEHLDLEFDFQPDSTGVQITLKVHTTREIVGSYMLQQCLRFTGRINQKWRTKIARVPYLSEFDMQAMGRPNASLTNYRQNSDWGKFPVQHTAIHTKIRDHNLEKERVADHGLIVRESPHREEAPKWYWDRVAPGTSWNQVSSGMYWERTAKISNRHPADCVHAWIDIGPMSAGETRIIRGKYYYLEGSKDDLLRNWEREFNVAA